MHLHISQLKQRIQSDVPRAYSKSKRIVWLFTDDNQMRARCQFKEEEKKKIKSAENENAE
jgi:hypothetical protein